MANPDSTLTQTAAWVWQFNSLVPGRFQFNFRKVIFKLTLVNGGWGISHEIALRWMPLDLTDDKSTLVQVMACCHQATSHYLSQCWPRSMSLNGVARPQWVKWSPPGQIGRHFADGVFRCIFINEKFCILIKISLKFAAKGPIDKNATLVQIMSWHRTGDKPLPEAIMTQFMAHICGTRGRLVNSLRSKLHEWKCLNFI